MNKRLINGLVLILMSLSTVYLDDNVHHQNTILMARALEKEDVLFQNLLYPDQAHGMGSLRPHLYHSLANFVLNDCFGKNVTNFR